MLLARAPIATRFVHEYRFFHDVSNPVIQSLRSEFISEMNRVQPRFVIDVQAARPYVSGPDTTQQFAELDALLATHSGSCTRATDLPSKNAPVLGHRRVRASDPFLLLTIGHDPKLSSAGVFADPLFEMEASPSGSRLDT
jgi:hypothetical protein